MDELDIRIETGKGGTVSGVISLPDAYNRQRGMIIAHGSGNDMNHPLLAFLAHRLAEAGVLSMRFNFPYREKGRRTPDSNEVLCDAWESAFRLLALHPEYGPQAVLAAGKSLGARIATQLVAEKKLRASGLILLGYPLHAPGKKDLVRDAHLLEVAIPILFIEGTRDPFCDLEQLRKTRAKLSAPHDLEVVDGGDHSFNLPPSAGISREVVYDRIAGRILSWLAQIADGH